MSESDIILYIEDNIDNQRLVQRVLAAHGYRVIVSEDGPSGLALARESTPALILVDINIPGLNGYETTTRLRSMEHLSATPIVALTADSQPGTRERSLAAGCDGYITKPVDARRLPAQILEFVGGKREALPAALETATLRAYTHTLVERLERQVREISAANAELQELDRLKSQFLATLSHELRTPLTSINGYLALFERGTLGQLTPQQRDAIGVIARNAQTLTRQLNNLLFFQEARTADLHYEQVELGAMVERLLAEVQRRAAVAGIELRTSVNVSEPYEGDSLALEQAFRNLLENALIYTPPGGRITVLLSDAPTRVIFRVQDTGAGIPPAAQEKIFLPFYQVDSSLTRPCPGAGLGLAIVKHVVEAHGGQVTVRSAPGDGSVFTVVLPRCAPQVGN